jgi:hypothetical protein
VLQAIPATLYLPQFGLNFPVMRVAGMGDYFPVRAFCKRIGLAPQPQLERLQADASYAGGLETFTGQLLAGHKIPYAYVRKSLLGGLLRSNHAPCASWRSVSVFPWVNSNRRSWTPLIDYGGA